MASAQFAIWPHVDFEPHAAWTGEQDIGAVKKPMTASSAPHRMTVRSRPRRLEQNFAPVLMHQEAQIMRRGIVAGECDIDPVREHPSSRAYENSKWRNNKALRVRASMPSMFMLAPNYGQREKPETRARQRRQTPSAYRSNSTRPLSAVKSV